MTVLKGQGIEHRFKTTGDLIPDEEVEIRSQIQGKIMEIAFKEGDRVEKGELLLRIDDRSFEARKEGLEAELELAKKELGRMKEMLEVDGVSQQEVDQAENRVRTLKANIKELQVSIDQANIEAPFPGRIGLRSVSQGDLVDAGTQIATLVKEHPLKLDFSVPSDHAHRVEEGMEIAFSMEEEGIQMEAEVIATEARMDGSTRALRARALVGNKERQLMPGSFVRTDILLEEIDSALMIPSEALLRDLNSEKVWVIRNGKAKEVEVETGLIEERAVQLVGGVEAGDSVLVTGLLQVREGMPLRVRNVVEPELEAVPSK